MIAVLAGFLVSVDFVTVTCDISGALQELRRTHFLFPVSTSNFDVV